MPGKARVVPFERKLSGRAHLMDTGEDSIFCWYSYNESWDRNPTIVPVHMHDEVDETIVVFDSEGYYLHGPTPETVVKSPFKGPCLLYLPAGEYHRIVTTSAGSHEAVLIYTKAGTVIDPFDEVIARAHGGVSVEFAKLEEVQLSDPSKVIRAPV
jgi:hypothetical protein